MKKQVVLFIVLIVMSGIVSAQINSNVTLSQKKQTVGVAIDLLPPIMSATAGKLGYSAQLWYGYKNYRIRGVIAGFTMPDKIMGNDVFTDLKTNVTALIFDYFLKENFSGWWFGAGIERWNNEITSKTANRDYSFNNYVATIGSGYIFKVYKNFYVEPWGALHYVLNDESVAVGESKYETKKFQGEVSLKVGWHF